MCLADGTIFEIIEHIENGCVFTCVYRNLEGKQINISFILQYTVYPTYLATDNQLEYNSMKLSIQNLHPVKKSCGRDIESL